MSSESREVQHNQHAHPTNRFYLTIGLILLVLTGLEVVGYLGEESGALGPGMATTIILLLSALKFGLVVALYMHLKFDHKLFTGIFVFPALLATLVICGMIFLFGPIHGTSTAIERPEMSHAGIQQPSPAAPGANPGGPATPPPSN
jgi:cytochrome c oxidase subunit 4